MTKVLKKHAEAFLREASAINGNKGRSMNYEAISSMARHSARIVELFALYVERSLPEKHGRGSRIQKHHVELAYLRFYEAIREFMDNEGEEEE